MSRHEDRLNYIVENEGGVFSTEIGKLNRRVKSMMDAEEYQNGAEEVIFRMKHELHEERYQLKELKDSLRMYIGEKGLSQSLIKMEDLLKMLDSDIGAVNYRVADINEAVKKLKEQREPEGGKESD